MKKWTVSWFESLWDRYFFCRFDNYADAEKFADEKCAEFPGQVIDINYQY